MSTKTIHGYVRKNCSLRSLKIKQVKQLLNDKTYFKFTFVRNPWTRIASAYLDKFVVMKRLGKPVLSALYGFYGNNMSGEQLDKSITFSQFVSYLYQTEDQHLNVHWKPQHLFFEGIDNLDFIGRFENLAEDYQYLKRKLKIPFNLLWLNKNYQIKADDTSPQDYSSLFPSSLRKMECLPDYRSLYNVELIELVRARFSQDIQMFNYTDKDLI